jgi:hypothetical protein
LTKPDFEEDLSEQYCFTPEPVFDLIQMDGCVFRYFKIKNDKGNWQKPNVIEFYDTGSRYMFVLDAYFSESSLNSVDLFRQFLLSTPFPQKQIRIRPDNAKGFLNLKRAFNALNMGHSVPGGFYMKPDFARIHAAKEKAHLESSHRSLHNFEIRIIKAFEDRIIKTEPGYSFAHGKKDKITVTFLNITLADLKNSGLIETYRREHNSIKHYFSENGEANSWIPDQKLNDYFKETPDILSFSSQEVKEFVKYGFTKTTATVSKKRTIRYDNQDYYVTVGADLFSRHKSTPVHISQYHDKLFIFEQAPNGILLGEALAKNPYEKPTEPSEGEPEQNELEQVINFLEQHNMMVDRPTLIEYHHKGLSLALAKNVFQLNQNRYITFMKKIRQPEKRTGEAVFNAFLLDCGNHLRRVHIAPYASHGEK